MDTAVRRHRWRWLLLGVLIGFTVFAIIAYPLTIHHFIPRGLNILRSGEAFYGASESRGIFSSPAGTSRVEVITNDAGAMHSGNFWTWIIVEHWWGKEIVAQGFLGSSRIQDPVPLSWTGEKSFMVTFCKSRYSDETEAIEVDLK